MGSLLVLFKLSICFLFLTFDLFLLRYVLLLQFLSPFFLLQLHLLYVFSSPQVSFVQIVKVVGFNVVIVRHLTILFKVFDSLEVLPERLLTWLSV